MHIAVPILVWGLGLASFQTLYHSCLVPGFLHCRHLDGFPCQWLLKHFIISRPTIPLCEVVHQLAMHSQYENIFWQTWGWWIGSKSEIGWCLQNADLTTHDSSLWAIVNVKILYSSQQWLTYKQVSGTAVISSICMGEDVQKIVGKQWGGAYKWLLITWWGIWGHFFWVIIEARILKTSWFPFITFVPSRFLTPLQMLSGLESPSYLGHAILSVAIFYLRYLFLTETAFVRSVTGSAYCWIFQPFKFPGK